MAWWSASEQLIGKLTAPTVSAASPQAAPLALDEAEMPPEKAVVTTAKVPVKNVVLKRSGSGTGNNVPVADLPTIQNIQWEPRADRPGIECWYAPQGSKAPRSSKTYLGYIGKRLLAEWEAIPKTQREQVVQEWVADRLAGKGINDLDE